MTSASTHASPEVWAVAAEKLAGFTWSCRIGCFNLIDGIRPRSPTHTYCVANALYVSQPARSAGHA